MNVARTLKPAGLWALAVASLAACSTRTSSSPTVWPAGTTVAMRVASGASCTSKVVYATSYDNSIYEYDQANLSGGPCAQITGLSNPQGIFVDAQRNLWVVNGGTKTILEFAPGGSSPMQTLNDPSGFPVDVTVDAQSGTVYVSNFFQNGSLPGVIEVYASGSTSPTATLSDPNMAYAFYDAVDAKGNLYVTFLTPSGQGQVNRWRHGTGSPQNLGISLHAPGGIATTSSGALLICDQSAPACGEFARGKTRMTHKFATSQADPFAVALDRSERTAFVADSSAGNVTAWKYPGPDAHPLAQLAIPNGAYAGVAASPAAPAGRPW